MTYAVSVDYISASTNRHSHAADASGSSLVAFGSNRLVALWNAGDELDRGVLKTLPGHEGLVTCVRFIQDDSFVSADDRGSLRLWRNTTEKQWHSSCVHQAHEKAISTLTILDNIIATAASDSLVKIWNITINDGQYELQETQAINLRGKYALSLALSLLPQSQAVMLAIGGTDRSVHIWTRSDDQFVSSAVLSGHEDWIRSLAFRQPENNNDALVLASASQDATIRLWNIDKYSGRTFSASDGSQGDASDDLLDAFEASLGDLADAEEGGRQISLKRHIVTVKAGSSSQQFTITFDALLIGHEAGVTSLSWRPNDASFSAPTLLSTSTDSSLILWSPSTTITSSQDGSTSIWINRQRFGDVGGQRLGGFVGGLWTRNGMEAAAWGWNGGWRRWRCTQASDDTFSTSPNETWTEVGAITGHSAPVKGLSWSPGGEYLLSASLDQTTRIHGSIPITDHDETTHSVWHEIGRPQVHGYDLVGVASLYPLRFVSIADEKVARVFEAPREFIEIVNNLGVARIEESSEERPRAATVPPLGLSNKAISEVSAEAPSPYTSTRVKRRPFEGELAAITLWPEIEKIFGHGYESINVAASNSKKYIATACKATSADHAVVRVYETTKWQPYGQPLAGHTLTVTRIAFSPDDRYVLTVSRDRSWRLFENGENGYVPIAADRTHARIIWDCVWTPEGDAFATASRDKSVKIWTHSDVAQPSKWVASTTIKTTEAATAVAFAPTLGNGRRILAVALESGHILLYSSPSTRTPDWQLGLTVDPHLAHIDHVHHLVFRPSSDKGTLQLASCGEDNTLKVLSVRIANSE